MKVEIEKAEIKRVAELLKERVKASYVVRKATQPLREVPYEQIFIEAALLLLSYSPPNRKINDKEFDDYWSKLKKDYLQFVLEQEKMYLTDIEKVLYSLKGKKL